jgi:hypothetical protein
MPGGGTLDLTVTVDGAPAPGALVELRYPDGSRVVTGMMDFIQPAQPADPLGRFRKPRLPPGSAPLSGTVTFTPPRGGAARRGTFTVVVVDGADSSASAQVQ